MKAVIKSMPKINDKDIIPGFIYKVDGCVAKQYHLCLKPDTSNFCIVYARFSDSGSFFTESFMNGYVKLLIKDLKEIKENHNNPPVYLFLHVGEDVHLKFMNMPSMTLQHKLYSQTNISKVFLLMSYNSMTMKVTAQVIANIARAAGREFSIYDYNRSEIWLSELTKVLAQSGIDTADIDRKLKMLELLSLREVRQEKGQKIRKN